MLDTVAPIAKEANHTDQKHKTHHGPSNVYEPGKKTECRLPANDKSVLPFSVTNAEELLSPMQRRALMLMPFDHHCFASTPLTFNRFTMKKPVLCRSARRQSRAE